MKKTLIIFLGCFIMIIGLPADNPGKNILPFKYEVKYLDNGLKVILIPTSAQGIVAYYSVVRTGSRDEYESGHSGFAHFFEHMMFRGTKNYPARMYDSLVISMGADANAYTTDDYTCYHLNITKDNLELVMKLESDRFQNLFYEEPEFKTESGAVYGEYRKGKTNPFFWVYEKMFETAFDAHTYKHTTIGFEKDIAAMPTMYDYSKDFFKRYYRPENVVLCVVGDINSADVMTKIKKYYTPWNKGYVNPLIPAEPVQTAPKETTVNYPGKTLPLVAIGYKSLSFNPKDKLYLASQLVSELLFGETSYLYKKLFLKEQTIQVLETEFSINRDPNLNAIYVMVKKESDIKPVIKDIYDEIKKYQTTLIDSRVIEDLKKRMKYLFLMGLETPDRIAGSLARVIALTSGVESIDDYYNTLNQVTAEDIMNALKVLFTPENRTTVILKGATK